MSNSDKTKVNLWLRANMIDKVVKWGYAVYYDPNLENVIDNIIVADRDGKDGANFCRIQWTGKGLEVNLILLNRINKNCGSGSVLEGKFYLNTLTKEDIDRCLDRSNHKYPKGCDPIYYLNEDEMLADL
jgi:hypothetical protein